VEHVLTYGGIGLALVLFGFRLILARRGVGLLRELVLVYGHPRSSLGGLTCIERLVGRRSLVEPYATIGRGLAPEHARVLQDRSVE
jgi:hypothetical protein